ncbi:uncharacterized protein LOC144084971 [Stigmatopora argus]
MADKLLQGLNVDKMLQSEIGQKVLVEVCKDKLEEGIDMLKGGGAKSEEGDKGGFNLGSFLGGKGDREEKGGIDFGSIMGKGDGGMGVGDMLSAVTGGAGGEDQDKGGIADKAASVLSDLF